MWSVNATTDTSDSRLSFSGCPGAHNDRTIGPEACRGMRAAPIVARVATAPPTLQTVGMVVVSGGQARGGGNGKRGGGRLVGALVGDVRGCQAAAHLGLSRTLFWHRLKLLPVIGGMGVPFPRQRLGTV